MNQNEVYVGARYVPVFADPVEWSSDRDYEPLTIVTHNYDTYTSRQYVPEGIDIDNQLFWVKSGNTGGVIGDFTEQIEALQEDMGTAQTDIGTLQTDVGTLGTTVGNNTTAIGTLQTSVGNNTSAIGALQTDVTALSDAIAAISSTYSNVQAMLDDYNAMSAADLAEKVGEVVRTACFVDMANGGGAFYQLVNDATLTANNMDVFGLNTTGYFVKLVPDAVVSLEQFGIVRSATTGYAGVATHTAIAYVCNSNLYKSIVGNNTYNTDQTITINCEIRKSIDLGTIVTQAATALYIEVLQYSQLSVQTTKISFYPLLNKVINNEFNLVLSGSQPLQYGAYSIKGCTINIWYTFGNITIQGSDSIFNLLDYDSTSVTIQQCDRSIINVPKTNSLSLRTNVSECIIFTNAFELNRVSTGTNATVIINASFYLDNVFVSSQISVYRGKVKINDCPIIKRDIGISQTINSLVNYGNYFIPTDNIAGLSTITLDNNFFGYDTTNVIYVDNSRQLLNISYNETVIFDATSMQVGLYEIKFLNDTTIIKTLINNSTI